MKKLGLVALACALFALGLSPVMASGSFWLYSTDLGSDLDLSDPVTTTNNWMDCGDIYRPDPSGVPLLWKNDDGPTNIPPWTGWPFLPSTPIQPSPALIGSGGAAALENVVLENYEQYFDLDAEDQIELIDGQEIFPDMNLVRLDPALRYGCDQNALPYHGIYFRAPIVYVSFEDDKAPGWYKTGDVPTTTVPDNFVEIWDAPLKLPPASPPPPGVPVNYRAIIGEIPLNLGPCQLMPAEDDDVDALDLHNICGNRDPLDGAPPFEWRYWSPDHEANLGLNPGSIYKTRNGVGQNMALALDQAVNFGLLDDPTTQDIIEDADIDAFEFISIDVDGFSELFGYDPGGVEDVLIGLFSVDEDDPDTPTIDESGGLLPYMIYASDLVGNYAEVQYDPEFRDIDAITVGVPEPGSVILLIFGALALMGIKKRR